VRDLATFRGDEKMSDLRTFALTLLLGTACAGCEAWQSTGTEDGGGPFTITELKYRLDTRYNVFFCDPDFWPVVRGDEQERALHRFPEIAADAEEFQAILQHLGLTGRTEFTAAEKLSIYREHKRLAAIALEPKGAAFAFSLRASETETRVVLLRGQIDSAGAISVRERTNSSDACPICLSGDTYIATAAGPVRVRDIGLNTLVYSLNDAQLRVLTRVERVLRVPAPADHEFVRLQLADGRELMASPGHPTADGRLLRDIVKGDLVDGSRVRAVDRIPMEGEAATYDLLPASGTGVYWANNVLMGSTLAVPRSR
jgi:hypothetical protein